MDIKKMLQAQKELDKANFKKGGVDEYPLQQVKTAYRVELGELLNEWQGFKFWKANKVIDRDKMVEEWADCMHFALSLESYLCEAKEEEESPDEFECDDFNCLEFDSEYKVINDCFSIISTRMIDTVALGLKLGFTLKELEQAYWNKYKINWERVNNGY